VASKWQKAFGLTPKQLKELGISFGKLQPRSKADIANDQAFAKEEAEEANRNRASVKRLKALAFALGVKRIIPTPNVTTGVSLQGLYFGENSLTEAQDWGLSENSVRR